MVEEKISQGSVEFFFCFIMEYILGFISLNSFFMADILGYFCTSSEILQNGGLEDCHTMND